jgi:hypothetical protein
MMRDDKSKVGTFHGAHAGINPHQERTHMKSLGLLSAAAGVIMLGLSGAANAAPIGTSLPALTTLAGASENGVEQVHYRRHRRHCGFVWHRGHRHWRCWW